MDFDVLVECFKAMGDKTRLKILSLLRSRELCVYELVELLQATQPAISQHLRKLRFAKLVKERRDGQWVYYSLDASVYPFFDKVLESFPDMKDLISRLFQEEGKMEACCK